MRLPPSSAARPVSSMRPTIRRPGIPSRRPEMRSVSPTPRPLRAAHDAGTSASVGRVRRERNALRQARPPDRGVDVRVDAEHEEREDALVLARRGRDGEAALRHRRRGNDPGLRADRLHRPRAEALVGEGAQADIGPAEKRGRRALERLLGGRSRDDRARHRGDAERDADDRQCGAKPARQQAAPRERSEAHRSYSPRAESRRMSGVASWSLRRPRSISSRISPSRTTSTRSA